MQLVAYMYLQPTWITLTVKRFDVEYMPDGVKKRQIGPHRGLIGSDVKVRFGQVLKVCRPNPEPDLGFGSTPLPEPWTGPSVLVQGGSVQVQRGGERRTGPFHLLNHNF
jgi:hypothetical protein